MKRTKREFDDINLELLIEKRNGVAEKLAELSELSPHPELDDKTSKMFTALDALIDAIKEERGIK